MSDNNKNSDTSLPVYKDQVNESLSHNETNNCISVEPIHGSISNCEQTIGNNLPSSVSTNDGDNEKATTSTKSNDDYDDENDIPIGMSDNNQNSETNTLLPVYKKQVHESLSRNETNDCIIVEPVHVSISNCEQTIDNNLPSSVSTNGGDNEKATTSTNSNEDNDDDENDIPIGIMSDNDQNSDTTNTLLPVYKDQVHESYSRNETNNCIIVEPVHESISNCEQTIDNNLPNYKDQLNEFDSGVNGIDSHIDSLDDKHNSENTVVHQSEIIESSNLITAINHDHDHDGHTVLLEAFPVHNFDPNLVFAQVIDGNENHNNVDEVNDTIMNNNNNETNTIIDSLSCQDNNSKPISIISKTSHETNESTNNGRGVNDSASTTDMKDHKLEEKRKHLILFMLILIIAVVVIIVVAVVLVVENNRDENNNNNVASTNDSSSTSSSNNTNNITSTTIYPTIILRTSIPTSSPTTTKESIESGTELMSLVDQLMSWEFNNTWDTDNNTGILISTNETISDENDDDIKTLLDEYGIIEFWDVSKVDNFSSMFSLKRNYQNLMFNYDLNDWNVSNAVDLSAMFEVNDVFNGNLSNWDVSNVEFIDYMFYGTYSFIGTGLDLWNISTKVTTLNYVFMGAMSFDCNLSNWDVSNVLDMRGTFDSATNFTGTGLEQWNVSQLITANGVFKGTESFIGYSIETWNVSSLQNMGLICKDAIVFDANLSNWNIGNVKLMNGAFHGAQSFRGIGIEKWDVSKVTDITFTFGNTYNFNANLSLWNVSNVVTADLAFVNATSFEGIGLELWDLRNVKDIFGMFDGATIFQGNDLSKWTLPKVTSLVRVFAKTNEFIGYSIEKWNVQKITDMRSLFDEAKAFNGNLSNWDVSSVVSMFMMFKGAESFVGNGLSNWNVNNVVTMDYMFANTIQFHGENINNHITNWNISNVQTLIGMFSNSLFNGNLSGWDVSNVLSFNSMFMNASNFIGYGLDQWNIQYDADTMNMFCGATNFDIDYISSWNITNYDDMFC